MDKTEDADIAIRTNNTTAKMRRIKTTHHHFWGLVEGC
jgi:hypothetical protein